ncbi:MAG: hypothetical protein ABL959_10200, partial [Pyrinomonadaceae bacterium]
MTKRFIAIILAALMLFSAPASFAQKAAKATAPAKPNFGNVEAVTAKQLREYLTFIASDELEGRDTPSRGLDIAAMYIAQHLASWNIKPAGDSGSYFQKFPLRRSKIDVQNMRLDLDGQPFVYAEDYFSTLTQASVPASNLVYVSHGW